VHKALPALMVLLAQLDLLVLLVHRVLLDLPEQRMQQISQVSWQ
jgi:hypothetical protein